MRSYSGCAAELGASGVHPACSLRCGQTWVHPQSCEQPPAEHRSKAAIELVGVHSREKSNFVYVPTYLYSTIKEPPNVRWCSIHSAPLLALNRSRMSRRRRDLLNRRNYHTSVMR